ncbi:MAG: outer membrane protein assembly factor BamA [Bacteroidales bacterium]
MKRISIALFFLIGIVVTSFSQDYSKLPVIDYKAPREYTIEDIKVKGIEYLDENILINISGLRKGQKIMIPGEAITQSVERLWTQGLFSDVNIAMEKTSVDGVVITIILKEQPRLSEFLITGLKKSETKDILEKLEMKKGRQVSENLLDNTEKIIKDYLKDKKFLNAEVNLTMVDDTVAKMNNVFLQVDVDKGDKVKIKSIDFIGNTVFSDGKLRRAMKETNVKNLNFFKPSKFMRKTYEEDKELVLAEYREQGYRDAQIVRDTVYHVSNDRLAIEIEVEEGEQYFFRDFEWIGNTQYTSRDLTRALKIDEGDPYNIDLLQERLTMAEDAVGNLYLDNGYLFFNVNPVIKNIDKDSVDMQLRMYEGDRVRINEVIIHGNDKTNEHVIRRELRTRPGDLFSKSDIMRSQRELSQLGFFDPESFGIEPININQSEGTVDLKYTLVEKANDQLEISGGWGANMLVGTIGLRFSNFSARRIFEKDAWKPVPSGDGQTLSLRAQTNGRYYKSYSLSFTEPWLGGKRPNSLTVSLFHSIQNNANIFYQVDTDKSFKITGASVSLGRRLKWPDDYFTMSHTLSFQKYNLENWDRYFFIDNGASNNFSFTTNFGRNSVDQPIYPRRGSSFNLTLQLTPPYSLFKESKWWELSESDVNRAEEQYEAQGDEPTQTLADIKKDMVNQDKYNWIEFHKWKFKGQWYLKLIDDLVLATNTEFGYLGHYNNDLGPSPFGSFDVGGDGMSGYSLYGIETIALRGYENGTLTPPAGGNVYQKVNLELRYPLTLKPQATIYALAFVEAGNAWYDIEAYNPFVLRRSAGIGLRAFLPMFGLLGIDWGYGFDAVPGAAEPSGGQFHFVIGQQF